MSRTLRREKIMRSLVQIHGQQYGDKYVMSTLTDIIDSMIFDQSKASEAA